MENLTFDAESHLIFDVLNGLDWLGLNANTEISLIENGFEVKLKYLGGVGNLSKAIVKHQINQEKRGFFSSNISLEEIDLNLNEHKKGLSEKIMKENDWKLNFNSEIFLKERSDFPPELLIQFSIKEIVGLLFEFKNNPKKLSIPKLFKKTKDSLLFLEQQPSAYLKANNYQRNDKRIIDFDNKKIIFEEKIEYKMYNYFKKLEKEVLKNNNSLLSFREEIMNQYLFPKSKTKVNKLKDIVIYTGFSELKKKDFLEVVDILDELDIDFRVETIEKVV